MISNKYVPTPKEILQHCDEIRSQWTEEELIRRKKPRFLSVWLPLREEWAMIAHESVHVQPAHDVLAIGQ